MKLLLPCIAVGIVCWVIAPITQAQDQTQTQYNPIEKFVLDGKEAVVVLPPELIAEPTIKSVYISPDGNNLIVLREKTKITPALLLNLPEAAPKLPEGEQELIYWNARTRTARSFWKGPLFEVNVLAVQWIPQTEIVYLVMQSLPQISPNPDAPIPAPEWKLLRMTEGQTRPTEIAIPNPGFGGNISISASKKLPLLMLHIDQENGDPPRPDGSVVPKTYTYLIRRDGRLDTPLTIPNADNAVMVFPKWDKDGKPVIYHVSGNRADGDTKIQHYAVNPSTLALTPIEDKFEKQSYEEPDRTRAGVLFLKPQNLTATVGDVKKPLPVLWLESTVQSKFPRLLLAGDATEGTLMPKGNGAFYQSHGALWYTPFLRLDQAQFLAMRKAALKQIAISNAKQAGLGLMMYAQDYNEALPDPDGIKEKILPYVKNGEALDGLVYTHGGGKLADIDKPAETIMGYIPGPGGRANIYVDGHVRWQDNPKP